MRRLALLDRPSSPLVLRLLAPQSDSLRGIIQERRNVGRPVNDIVKVSGFAAVSAILIACATPRAASAQTAAVPPSTPRTVSLIQMPFTGARNVPEISQNPAYLDRNGIGDTILSMGFRLVPDRTVALTEMFKHPKVAALGIASTPADDRDPDRLSLAATYNLIKGALQGVRQRAGG